MKSIKSFDSLCHQHVTYFKLFSYILVVSFYFSNKVLNFFSLWMPLILFCSFCYVHNRKHTFLEPVTSLWHEDANNLMIFSYILVVSFYFPNKVLTVCSMWTPLILFCSPCKRAYCIVFAMKGNRQRAEWFKMGPFRLKCYLHNRKHMVPCKN